MGMVAHTFNARDQEVQAGRSVLVQGQFELCSWYWEFNLGPLHEQHCSYLLSHLSGP